MTAARANRRPTHGGDQVTGRILSFISAQRFAPGERLPSERDLADAFKVSRTAVREALATLEAMRVIERRPNSGIYLSSNPARGSFESLVLRSDLGLPLDRAEMLQAMEMRFILDVQAIELACARRTEADLQALRDILATAEARLAAGEDIMNVDEAFHLCIVAATHNDVFVRIVHAFFRLSRARRQAYFADRTRSLRSHREHCAILRALESGDAARGVVLMRRHIRESFSRGAYRIED